MTKKLFDFHLFMPETVFKAYFHFRNDFFSTLNFCLEKVLGYNETLIRVLVLPSVETGSETRILAQILWFFSVKSALN